MRKPYLRPYVKLRVRTHKMVMYEADTQRIDYDESLDRLVRIGYRSQGWRLNVALTSRLSVLESELTLALAKLSHRIKALEKTIATPRKTK